MGDYSQPKNAPTGVGEGLSPDLGRSASGISYHEMPILPNRTEPKRPKKAEKEPLDHWVHVRLSEKDEENFKQLQTQFREKNRSHLVRKIVREMAGLDFVPAGNDLTDFRNAVRELGALGRNINQIARVLNSGKTAPTLNQALLHTVAEQIAGLKEEVAEIIRRASRR